MFPVLEVPPEASELPETLGTKPKFWFTAENGVRTLYKEGWPGSGEHWSEKACCELAQLIGVPRAEYQLARWMGRQGVVSPTFVPERGRLVLGNELLAKFVKSYQRDTMRYKTRQYTVRSVMTLLGIAPIAPPLGWELPDAPRRAPEIFCGYLLLDALVGNQDRHHENWGLIVSPTSQVSLAPSFDHASSLGRNETDEVRLRRLHTNDTGDSIDQYCGRAISPFYLGAEALKPIKTMDAFLEGAKLVPVAATFWLNRVSSIANAQFKEIFAQIPENEMSGPAKEFALRMLTTNRERLMQLELTK